MAAGSKAVILRALIANAGIAVAKFVAAGITGSSAMVTEGVHSVVDTTNQVLLLYGTKRSERPPSAMHPLGYGRELYFWAFVVAMLIFALGAGISLYEGVRHFLHPEPTTNPLIAFAVLGIALVLEGWALLAARRQFNAARGDAGIYRAIRETKDAGTLVVLLEDSAAVSGLLVAAAGIALSVATGDARWDALASIVIGLILAATAVVLLIEAKALLIGESADPMLVKALRECAAAHDGIVTVKEVLTVHQAPDMVVAVISADFEDTISARQVEETIAAIERQIDERFPVVARVYVRPVAA